MHTSTPALNRYETQFHKLPLQARGRLGWEDIKVRLSRKDVLAQIEVLVDPQLLGINPKDPSRLIFCDSKISDETRGRPYFDCRRKAVAKGCGLLTLEESKWAHAKSGAKHSSEARFTWLENGENPSNAYTAGWNPSTYNSHRRLPAGTRSFHGVIRTVRIPTT